MTLEDFKLPIKYQNKTNILNNNIVTDLELKETENNPSIYEHIFEPKTIFGKNTSEQWYSTFSYDNNFLKESKKLIKSQEDFIIPDDISFNEINDIYNEINNNKYFNNKYLYINIDFLKHLNQNELILQACSLYNIGSPLFSLLTPLILILVPFFLIKLQGHPVTFENYFIFLKQTLSQHTLGSLFTDFDSVDTQKKIYIFFSLIFYVYQIYQNILSCIEYFTNLSNIHNYLFKLKRYLQFSTEKMNTFYNLCTSFKCYKKFNKNLINHKEFLENFKNQLEKITPYAFNFNKIKELGYILKIFYNLKNDKLYLKSLKYSFDFNGYLENLSQIKYNINHKFMNFSNYSKKVEFTNAYYPPLKYKNPIKNSYCLDKHIIITGPNASGKSTILKTSAINIILNQQIGCGFYQNANLKLYEYIHSYINIPDTSGRDSLFQAEARRCKEIIDIIDENPKNKNHLCIFDELYSGTNPYEAVSSAISLLKYLNNNSNINFILTTHYTDLCDKLKNTKNINNFKMNVINNKNNNSFDYTYKLIEGISYIKGGTKVLKELNYPKTIVNSVNNVLNDITI